MVRLRVAIALVSLAASMGLTSLTPASAAPAREGAACSTPLDTKTVTVGKKRKAKKVDLVCWQARANPDSWLWTAKSATQYMPFEIPASATWRRIATPAPGGNPNFQPTAASNIARLSGELDHYWIEVDGAGGKKVTAGVWAPKGASNRPVVVFFHGTGGLVYWETEYAANLAKSGFVVVTPLWFGPRTAFFDRFPAQQSPGLMQDPNGPTFTGANLELAYDMLPVLGAARQQPAANPGSLSLAGQSRGGTIALILGATTPGIKAVVAVVPPFLPTQLNSPMYLGQIWEVLPRAIVNKITVPTLVIGAANDELVPPSSTQDFLSAASSAGRTNIESVIVPGPHTIAYSFNTESSAQVKQLVVTFLNRFA